MQTSLHTFPHCPFKPEDLLGRAPVVLDLQNAAEEIRDRHILITGAAGTIGTGLAAHVCAYAPAKVILVDQAETALFELDHRLREQFPLTDICSQVASITDALRMARLFSQTRIHIVFHAAAYKHVPFMELHPYEAIKTNILGTEILADLAVSYRVSKFIYISTDKAVRPASVMGATKRFAELYLQYLSHEYPGKTQFIITRFGNVLGSNGSFLIRFAEQIREGGPLTVTHPLAERYLMTVTEACQLVLQAAAGSGGAEIWSVDMGEPVRIADIARKMIRLAGFEPGKDIQVRFTGLRPGEKLTEEINGEATPAAFGQLRKVRFPSHADSCMRYGMSALQKALDSGSAEQMVSVLKMAIPEYHSAHSPYEKLDQAHMRREHWQPVEFRTDT
ncbi:MAG: capsule biosynthesis protein CapD [Dyadobacter sp. 50-39]|uniref:polysaccharide biosynthesis protein n=1 Tax=Dyadobacter sp. 50-39 TaxID=1895756 RepID=UPI000960CF9C|nr:polysaccharide biosynthesis protein [Dyadobacter sp. 50-39]OJV18976.1 MAG: capsule biosynthesis protein CapD [Dyadobacter sp. 50-39]